MPLFSVYGLIVHTDDDLIEGRNSNILKLFVMKQTIDLTPEEYSAVTRNYPMGNQLYYIWVGILALRGYKLPFTLAEMSIKHINKQSYEVFVNV